MGLYKFDNTNVSDDDLSTLQKTLSSRFTNSVRYQVSLDDFDPKLIRRLTHRYHYHLLITDDEHPFQDLLILFRADDPADRIKALTRFSNTVFFNRIRWSAYKYAQLVYVLQSKNITYKDANNTLQSIDGFRGIDENINIFALEKILQPFYGLTNELTMLELACQKFEQDINNSGHSLVFLDGKDFKNIRTMLQVLDLLPISLWENIFSFRHIGSHLKFSFTDTDEVIELISVLDDDKRQTFLVHEGILEAILVNLNHTQRWMLVANNPDILSAYNECMKEADGIALLELMDECPDNVDAVVVKNINALARSVVAQQETKSEGTSSDQDSDEEPNGLAMVPYSFLSSMFPGDYGSLIVKEALSDNDCSLEDLEPELIRRLELKYHYSQLIPEYADAFQGLLILLRADDPKNRIPALKAPENQEMLKRISWSAYKYAQLLDICRSDNISHNQSHNELKDLDGFKNVAISIRSKALHGIIKPNEEKADGLAMLEFACKQFEQDIDGETFSLVFIDASDFADQETFLHALNIISMDHWSMLLGLPEMQRHLEFSFEDSEDAENLLDILDETRRITFLMWPGVMESFLGALSDEDSNELIESNTVVRVCYQEWLEEREMDSENDDVKTIDDFHSLIDAILNEELPEKISLLQLDDVQGLLKKFHWSTYKYASILAACATDYEACIELDRTLSAFLGFENVSESIRKNALENILKPMSEDPMRSYTETGFPLYAIGIPYYSAKAYSHACGEHRTDNNVFSHADDFEDIRSFIVALADIPLSSWEAIFALPGMDTHVPFLIQVDKDDTKDALTLFENDQDKYNAFMTRRNVHEAMLMASSIEEGQELRESTQSLLTDQESKQSDVSDAPIKDTFEYILSFSDLRNTLEITLNIDHIAYLSNPRLQEKLQNMHWNVFKYAALISICEQTTPCAQADEAIAQLPGFQYLNQSVRQLALKRIVKSIRYKEYKFSLGRNTFSIFTHACQLYSHDLTHITDPDPFFTHADDFYDHRFLITALNEIPLSHWPKIFSLPGMETHVPFLLKGYVQFYSFNPFKPRDLNILESLKIFKDETKLNAFLARPNVLEAILEGISREDRWKALAVQPHLQEAFCQRIGQGRGDKVLEILGDCPFKNEAPEEKGMSTIVLSAARRGYQQLDGTQGLSSAQCKSLHFFSSQTQTPHPFLEKLEMRLAPSKTQDFSSNRLK